MSTGGPSLSEMSSINSEIYLKFEISKEIPYVFLWTLKFKYFKMRKYLHIFGYYCKLVVTRVEI